MYFCHSMTISLKANRSPRVAFQTTWEDCVVVAHNYNRSRQSAASTEEVPLRKSAENVTEKQQQK